jgi:serine/threonine protein kinase
MEHRIADRSAGATGLQAGDASKTAQALVVDHGESSVARETAILLQSRLFRAAGIMFAAVLIFLARDFLLDVEVHSPFLWTLHVLTVVTLGLCYLWLKPAKARTMFQLVCVEKLIFGVPTVLLLLIQRQLLLIAADSGTAHDPVGPWLILMLTYALFIPTTLRRAVVIVGALALAPLVLIGGGMLLHESVRHSWNLEELTRITLCMFFGAGALIYGSMTIGSLRKEAIQAKRLGQYTLKQMIGSGGMGHVYLAEHQLLKRQCAVKLIAPTRAADPRVLARFEQEVRTTATLTHSNTVEIYDYGRTEEGTFYYVMEYLTGMNLADLVAIAGPLPSGRVIYLLQQVCGALHEAHSIGFIHRDVKPANIFCSVRGGVYDFVKLLDFGLVKVVNAADNPLVDEGVVGSPHFMSPEQAAGERVLDARSDIYSLGAVAYYLLCGRPPFQGRHPLQILMRHVQEPPTPPSQLDPNVPMDLESIVLCCLEKSPAARFQSVRELSNALANCEAAGTWSSEQAEAWWTSEFGQQTTSTITGDETTAVTEEFRPNPDSLCQRDDLPA